MGRVGATTVKTVVRAEVADRAKRRAMGKNISLSDYLRRLLERDLGMDDEVFFMEDLENDLEEGRNEKVYSSAAELIGELHRECAHDAQI
jgi:hypothetical protein